MINRLKNNTFARNSLILFTGSMAANVINYFFHLVIGRMVSVQVYGEFESLASFFTIISVPAMTLTMVATKYSAITKAEDNGESSHQLFSLFNKKILKYGTPLFIISIFFTPYFRDFFKLESGLPLVLIWLVMFFSFFSAATSGIMNGWQKFKEVSWVGIISSLAKLLAAVVFIKWGFELNGIVGSLLLSGIVSYAVSVIILRFIFQKSGRKEKVKEERIDTGKMKKYILPVFVGTLVINILGNIDMVLAKHNLDAISAGYYGALTIVSKIIFFATSVIATVLFAMASEEYHKKNNSLKTLKYALGLLFAVCGGAILFYFLFPQFIMGMLFGSKYQEGIHYLSWFAILVSLFSAANLIIQYLLSMHQTKIMYLFLALTLAGVLLLFFLGTSIFAILIIMIMLELLVAGVGGIHLFLNGKKEIL